MSHVYLYQIMLSPFHGREKRSYIYFTDRVNENLIALQFAKFSATFISKIILFFHFFHTSSHTYLFFFCFLPHSQLSSCSLLMSGVPAVYYHGTGSENASRVYTETPMQHVQRTALRKKCMKSTFTLDCGKKERIRLLPYFCLSVRLSLRFRSYLYISSFNFLSLSLSLSLHLSIHLFLHLSVNISISPFVNLLFFFFTFSRNIDRYRYSLSALRNVSPMVSPFRSPSVSEGRDRAEAFSVPRH